MVPTHRARAYTYEGDGREEEKKTVKITKRKIFCCANATPRDAYKMESGRARMDSPAITGMVVESADPIVPGVVVFVFSSAFIFSNPTPIVIATFTNYTIYCLTRQRAASTFRAHQAPAE